MAHESSDITALIHASRDGDAGAFGQLVEAVYPELRYIALRQLRRQRADCTLQCTALINEAYLRLAQAAKWEWKDRAHFFGVASHVMRGILVDYARAKRTAKRGGGALTVSLSDCYSAAQAPAVDVLDIHEAMEDLEKAHPGQSRVVELRYFGGFSIEEVAELMGVSASTVKREWNVAKSWIHRRLVGRERHP
ncbi:MAG: sigma-70 family RNA polymerase sigma factor [Bryobacteraceae bacterium]